MNKTRSLPSFAVASLATAVLLAAIHAGATPGLFVGKVGGATRIDPAAWPAETNTTLSVEHGANNNATFWGPNTMWVYWGQIHLDGSTYRFGENIDDMVLLVIDGEKLLDDRSFSVPTFGTIERPAGWYDFELRMQNGGGSAGPVANAGAGFTTTKGFCFTKGTAEEVGSLANASTFVVPADPGDGSFFRHFTREDGLAILGEPVDAGTTEPPYGILETLEAGASVPCSAPATTEMGGTRYRCAGYRLETTDKNADPPVTTVLDEGTATSCVVRYEKPCSLVWLWEATEHVIAATASHPDKGTVSGGGAVPCGGTVTLTAHPAAPNVFLRWSGDLPVGVDPVAATISFPADRPRTLSAVFKTPFHVRTDGDDARSGRTPDEAFLTVARALEAAADGDAVLIGEGTFSHAAQLEVTNAVEVIGAGIGRTVLTTPQPANANGYRTIRLTNKEAVVRDLTITGGRAAGGTAAYLDAGTLLRCRVTGNRGNGAGYKSGAVRTDSHDAFVSYCVIDDNRIAEIGAGWGGGVYLNKGTLDHCLVFGNAAREGGGVYCNAGTIRSCTIAGNEAYSSGGGLFVNNNSTFENVLVAGNRAPYGTSPGDPEWGGREAVMEKSASHCCFANARACGASPASGDVFFRDPANGDFSLLPGSVAIDAGRGYDSLPALDLAGKPRAAGKGVDIGCLEYHPEGFECGFSAPRHALFEDETASFSSTVFGSEEADGALSYGWTLFNRRGGDPVSAEGPAPAIARLAPGRYDVTLDVTAGNGRRATMTRPDFLLVAARTNYLAPEGLSSPAFPWKTPETAGNDLGEIVAATIDGSVVLLAEGTYALTNEVVLDVDASLLGAGADRTVFVPAPTAGDTRLFKLNAPGARLEGVTIKGAHGRGAGFAIFIAARGGTLRSSRVTACEGRRYQDSGSVNVQSVKGLVSRCVIDCNTNGSHPYNYAAGLCLSDGVAENCLIARNVQTRSVAGVFLTGKGILRNCTIAGNKGLTRDCYASGIFLQNNNARAYNCLFAGNTADDMPADRRGPGWPEWQSSGNYPKVFHNCLFSDSATAGTDAVAADPLFRDPAAGDYTLLGGSGAIDKGRDVTWSEDGEVVDLAGNPRVVGDAVDIGCFEFSATELSCGFSAKPTALFEGETVELAPTVFGAAEGDALAFGWTLSNRNSSATVAFEGEAPAVPPLEAGRYDATLVVTAGDGRRATMTLPALVHVAARTNYLAPKGMSSPAFPWKTPGTAAEDLGEVVAETIDGSVVLLAEGTYALTNEVMVSDAVSLLGAGIDRTVLVPAGEEVKSVLVTLNHQDALLRGVTLRGAHFATAAAIGPCGGTIECCRATGCLGKDTGCGAIASRGTLGRVSRCVIDCNTNNGAHSYTAGIYLCPGTAENCLVVGNVCECAGGAYFATFGGGESRLLNCTIADNVCSSAHSGFGSGGIFYHGGNALAVNCIFAGNRADLLAEANRAEGWPEWRGYVDCAPAFRNCLFSDSPVVGEGSFAGDPLFRNPARGDYSILRRSPAHDAGLRGAWTEGDAVDLAGNPRIDREKVDLGCLEAAYASPGTLVIIR